ncbi:MAG: YraN family protein [Pseudomonadota bacterium]
MRDRRQAERAGRLAEDAAALFLMAKGYQIVARRFRARGGEIDLVARRRDVLAFIEVKRRPSLDEAVFAVGPRTRRRIQRAAAQFLAARPELAGLGGRYDILASAGLRMRHLRGAWLEGD